MWPNRVLRCLGTCVRVVRVKATPDPKQAEALERKRRALNYRPEHGFLLDRKTVERR